MDFEFLKKLIVQVQTKIVMLIMDGLGGLTQEPGGKTELETAYTPNLDELVTLSALGCSQPAGPGITVGNGPEHLALFGYDPIEYEIGRGALEELGADFELCPADVATLLYSKLARLDRIVEFGEHASAQVGLGVFPAKHVMPIALANAGRIVKYGLNLKEFLC